MSAPSLLDLPPGAKRIGSLVVTEVPQPLVAADPIEPGQQGSCGRVGIDVRVRHAPLICAVAPLIYRELTLKTGMRLEINRWRFRDFVEAGEGV